MLPSLHLIPEIIPGVKLFLFCYLSEDRCSFNITLRYYVEIDILEIGKKINHN